MTLGIKSLKTPKKKKIKDKRREKQSNPFLFFMKFWGQENSQKAPGTCGSKSLEDLR